MLDFLINIFSIGKSFGWSVAQFVVIIFLLWKIATNHLAHIAADIKEIAKELKGVATEVKDIKTQTASHGERIAKLEGKLE